jgi:hypothetical protein
MRSPSHERFDAEGPEYHDSAEERRGEIRGEGMNPLPWWAALLALAVILTVLTRKRR